MKLRPMSLGDWAPDQPATSGGARLTVAKNVIPFKRHYGPLQEVVEIGDALGARALGAVSVRDAAGGVHIYAGTAAALKEYNNDGSWTDRSKVGGYTATAATRWRFWAQDDRLFASNGQGAIQYIDMSTGTAFADLPGSPPLAQFGAAFGNFIFLANTEVSAQQVAWSSIANTEEWIDGVNQGGRETFASGGLITGFAVLDALYIFQETCIRRAVYVGPPAMFDFGEGPIETSRGCIAPGSLVQLGRLIFYKAEDGLYAFDGEQSTPIGVDAELASNFDQWFADTAQRDYFYRMTAAIDPRTKTVRWLFASTASPDGQPDRMLLYNWSAGRAAYAEVAGEVLTPLLTPSMTLEDLDALYASLDDVPFSLDDPLLAGGVVQLGLMGPNNKYARFAGDTLEAVLETDDLMDGGYGTTEVQQLAPLCDAPDVRMCVGKRFSYDGAITYTAESAKNVIGICPQRAQGRFVRVKARIPAAQAWTKAEGFAIGSVRRGGR